MKRINDLFRKCGAAEIQNEIAYEIVWRGFEYLDFLYSNSFTDLSPGDKVQMRSTLAHVADMCNWFLGNCLNEEDVSIGERALARKNCMEKIEDIEPFIRVYYPYESLPECIDVTNINVRSLVEKAHELVTHLINTKPFAVSDDWDIVVEILHTIILSTRNYYTDLSTECCFI